MIVAMRSNGKMILYDLLNIRKTDIKEKTRRSNTVNPQKGETGRKATPSNTSISNSSKNVNGKYSLKDAEGNKLTDDQQEFFMFSQVRMEEDEDYWNGDGMLLPVYHSTYDEFTVFSREKLGTITDANATDELMAATSHIGYWFNSQNLSESVGFGTRAEKVYLNIENPYHAINLEGLVNSIEAWRTRRNLT